jgi:hypothetical protein
MFVQVLVGDHESRAFLEHSARLQVPFLLASVNPLKKILQVRNKVCPYSMRALVDPFSCFVPSPDISCQVDRQVSWNGTCIEIIDKWYNSCVYHGCKYRVVKESNQSINNS